MAAVIYSDSLVDCRGLEQVENILYLLLEDNPNFSSFKGLEKLDSLRFLRLRRNHNITTLDSLMNPSYVKDIVFDSLLNLSQLDALTNIDYQLLKEVEITNCPLIESCAIENFCQYLENGGAAILQNNGGNCNSEEEIIDEYQLVSNSNSLEEQTTNKIIENFTELLQNDIKGDTNNSSLFFVIIHRDDQNLLEMRMQILFVLLGLFQIHPIRKK